MISQLEDDLRQALTDKVREVPDTTAIRLSSADYHPRTHSPQRRFALGTAVVVVVALVASVFVGNVGPGRQGQLAAWSATPTKPASGQVAAAETSCRRTINRFISHFPSHFPGASNEPRPQQWRQVLTQTRGAFTLVAYNAKTGDLNVQACLTNGAADRYGQLTGTAFGLPVSIASNTIRAATLGSSESYTVAIGEAGSAVTGITFVMAQGTRTVRIVATVAHGIYALWWPGNMLTESVQVTTPRGTTTGAFSPRDGSFVPNSASRPPESG
jgi:hypothetical protein